MEVWSRKSISGSFGKVFIKNMGVYTHLGSLGEDKGTCILQCRVQLKKKDPQKKRTSEGERHIQ